MSSFAETKERLYPVEQRNYLFNYDKRAQGH